MRRSFILIVAFVSMLIGASAHATQMRLAVTTSFHNSGLSDLLLPQIKEDLGLDVQLIVVGTGQALKLGRAGDVDAILVHSRKAEEKFIAEGFSTHRREIMFNDFVLIGPSGDPANIAATANARLAMGAVAATKSLFVSRGDDSGTHRKELALWNIADLQPENFSAAWYHAVGSGMGATLNTASGMNAYVMSGRASWLKFKNKGDLKMLFSGDPVLFNQYAYLPINPARHPHVKADLAIALENWLVGDKAQKMIGNYAISGETLFTPNATAE